MTEQPTEVVQRVRPLSAAAARNLMKLVENDFMTLQLELAEFFDNQTRTEEAEIRSEAVDQIAALNTSAMDIVREFEDKMRALQTRATREGFTMRAPSVTGQSRENMVKSDAVEAKVSAMRNRLNNEHRAALAAMKRKQNQLERRVLLASITTEVEAVLNDMPTARELMAEAVQELQTRALR
jgi:hypothetical protein